MHLPFLPPPSFKDAYYMHRIYECRITCTQYSSSPLDTYIYVHIYLLICRTASHTAHRDSHEENKLLYKVAGYNECVRVCI